MRSAALLVLAAASVLASASARARQESVPTSADVLALLPDGEYKRRFVVDCTGCHQFTTRYAFADGRARTEVEWRDIVERMVSRTGAHTGFPVISLARDPAETAGWLARSFSDPSKVVARAVPASASAEIREYLMPNAQDLPHDVAVLDDGRVLITGMMSHRMYVLDPATGAMEPHAIPVGGANPRAVELDAAGRWWIVLGAPGQVAMRDPKADRWEFFDVGVYAHSVALAPDGAAWFNGHFTHAPELIGRVRAGEQGVRTVELPRHPELGDGPGGPIPYEIRVARDGVVWMSELQGDRMIRHDPRTNENTAIPLPVRGSGPRRFDVDASGILWIPAYGDNALLRLDPATRRVDRFALPVGDATPYVARVDSAANLVWIGTSADDAIYAFDMGTRRFTRYALPSRGALVRHLAIDPRSGALWIAYGASPGIPARVAVLRRR